LPPNLVNCKGFSGSIYAVYFQLINFETMYCDLYDKEIDGKDKCATCCFCLTDKSKSELKQVHDAIKAKKKRSKVEVWQSVAVALSGILPSIK